MSYNHGAAQRAFEKEWQKKEKQYRELGMTDEQISSIREFDEKEFKADRAYLEKRVPLAEADEFRQTTIDESVIDNIEENWYEYITGSEKKKAVRNVPAKMRKAFYLTKVMGMSQQEVSSILLTPQQTISYWIVKIAEILR
ncbi:MAG: hypothetical protein NC177_14710 [Ruminococcus flavefaciens]|nr:hypothetical protein [Ruminococcus flavefaciens]